VLDQYLRPVRDAEPRHQRRVGGRPGEGHPQRLIYPARRHPQLDGQTILRRSHDRRKKQRHRERVHPQTLRQPIRLSGFVHRQRAVPNRLRSRRLRDVQLPVARGRVALADDSLVRDDQHDGNMERYGGATPVLPGAVRRAALGLVRPGLRNALSVRRSPVSLRLHDGVCGGTETLR
jgi:hypothetical protein